MKKNIILILATALAVVACDLNKYPLASLSPDSYFSNASEMDAFANNFYSDLPGTSVYEEESDMIIKMGLTNEMRGARTVPGSGGGWSWSALRNYNTLIDFSVNCKDDNVRNEYVAVARFFRAYFYLEKVKRFGDVPWYDTQLGSADEALYKPRDSRELVMAHVVEDLDFAIEHLPTKHSLYKVTKWTAMALKTRACLFEGTFRKYHNISFPEHSWQWYLEQAAAAGEEFIATSGYGIYNSGPNAYRDLFASTDAIGTEIILARDYDLSLNVKHNGTYYTLGNYGNPGMTRKMFCTYLMADGTRFTDKEGWQTMSFVDETKNRDPRLGQSIRIPGYKRIASDKTEAPSLADSETGYQPTKYMQGVDLGVDLYGASYNDLPLFRAAEVILNFAEAKAELGTLTQADLDKSIRLLRDRVGMPNINLAEANARPDPYLQAAETGYPNVTGPNAGVILEIRRERTVELFDENFRYYDIIRWKNGQAFKHQNLGLYFPGPGNYDLDGDGVIDHAIYTDTKPTDIPSTAITRKIGTDIFLTNGTSGYVLTNPTDPGSWNENRDYYYPIPTDELSLNENLVQNPGW
ncbi:MAG: RagB/SusD family nutrient uptake outer membrane protein [Bacteroidales bacterium]|nr:RagB/SusD family nutrient uptake outer membrane protein [Bacteroidales bacterium]